MKRAIGILRISEVGGREGDRFHSPAIQRERIERDCERWGLELADVFEELDVSGGRPIAKRKGLSRALAMVEADQAEAIVFAYRDRVERSIETGSELCRRMDAKGALLIADGRQITHATHEGWRHATLESFLNEDQRRAVGAKLVDVHRAVVARGVAPFILPPGYRRREDGVAEVDPELGPIVLKAWRMRADGASVPECWRLLVELVPGSRGARISTSVVTRMFRNRFYLGELHYRPGVCEPNLTAHEALVDPELWDRVQAMNGQLQGRRAHVPSLLGRIGILVCAHCGGRLSRSTKEKRRSPFYRCTSHDCDQRPAIVASLLEPLVVAETKILTQDLVGTASAASGVAEKKEALDAAEAALGRLLRRLAAAGVEDEAEAVEAARSAREARDAAQGAYDRAMAQDDAYRAAVTSSDVFEHGTLDEQRDLIRAVIDRIEVAKGSGTGRVTIKAKVDARIQPDTQRSSA